MKTKINFGKIAYFGNRKINEVTIEIELRNREKGLELAISGNVWNSTHTDIVAGGQCLDNLKRFFKRNDLFKEIYEYWEKYHLNDMHPECSHQRELGWVEQTKEPVTIYKFLKTTECYRKGVDIEQNALKRLKTGETVQYTPEEIEMVSIPWSIKSLVNEAPSKHFELKETENTTRGWVSYKDFPDVGLLSEPCPVCEYKYGTEWRRMEIPEQVVERIKQIITENNERTK